MEDEEEEAPLAVQIDSPIEVISQNQLSSSPPKKGDVVVRVIVIIGYLGAGKSTLVNHILNSQHRKRITIILNEFGEEIGMERAMINEGDGGTLVEEWVGLANGCISLTVKHSLVQALEQLVQKKERLDHILLDQLESAMKLENFCG